MQPGIHTAGLAIGYKGSACRQLRVCSIQAPLGGMIKAAVCPYERMKLDLKEPYWMDKESLSLRD